MASVTVCDHCGKPIEPKSDNVSVTVIDKTSPRFNVHPLPPSLSRSWDLHAACYRDAVAGALESAIGAPS